MEQGRGIAASPESIHTPAIHFSASSAAALEAAIKAKRKGAINLMYNKHKQQLLKLFGSALPARSQAPSRCPGCGSAGWGGRGCALLGPQPWWVPGEPPTASAAGIDSQLSPARGGSGPGSNDVCSLK